VFCRAGAVALLGAILLTTCARQSEPRIHRLAVLPLENLSGEAELDWIGPALATVMVHQIAGAPRIFAFQVDYPTEIHDGRATQVARGYFTRRGDRLEASLAVEDLETQRTARTAQAAAPLRDFAIRAGDALARQISDFARPFSTNNPDALRSFQTARATTDPAAALAGYERAVATDPDFGLAYLAWAQLLLSQRDRPGAERVVTAGLARGSGIAVIEKAQLELLRKSFEGETPARLQAMAELARLLPADSGPMMAIADLAVRNRDFARGIEWQQKASQVDPRNLNIWNSLGYTYAYNRDLKGAEASLREYQRRAPDEVNPLDSLGEVNYYLGRFPEAAQFFLMAHQKNPGFLGGVALVKGAHARLMLGDLAGADEYFKKYAELRRSARDPFIETRQAQWDFVVGRQRQAVSALEAVSAKSPGEPAAFGLAQLAVWDAYRGDVRAAIQHATRALATGKTPQTRSVAVLAALIAGASPSADAQIGIGAHAFQAIFARDFRRAVDLVQKLYAQTSPNGDSSAKVLLAWVFLEIGKTREALDLLQTWPLVQSGDEPAFEMLIFPRVLYLRGAALERLGQRREARSAYELFLKYAGDMPNIFSDTEKAKEALKRL
jgi:tetratricopeptide (TPR) repeat protein